MVRGDLLYLLYLSVSLFALEMVEEMENFSVLHYIQRCAMLTDFFLLLCMG